MNRPVEKKGDLLFNVALEFPVYMSAEMGNSLLLTEIKIFFRPKKLSCSQRLWCILALSMPATKRDQSHVVCFGLSVDLIKLMSLCVTIREVVLYIFL